MGNKSTNQDQEGAKSTFEPHLLVLELVYALLSGNHTKGQPKDNPEHGPQKDLTPSLGLPPSLRCAMVSWT